MSCYLLDEEAYVLQEQHPQKENPSKHFTSRQSNMPKEKMSSLDDR